MYIQRSMKSKAHKISIDEDLEEQSDQLSPAHKLFATALLSDDPEPVLNSADQEEIAVLYKTLKKKSIQEEYGVVASAKTTSRLGMIRFIIEFMDKGTEHIRLSGATDIMLDDAPTKNARAFALAQAGFEYEEDEKGKRVSPVRSQWESNMIANGDKSTIARPRE